MSLCKKIKVALPKSGIITRRSGKYHYVYKVTSSYRDENGQPTNTRISIGSLDEETGLLVPNNNYWEVYGNEENEVELLPTYNSVRSIGATFAIEKILEKVGVTTILESIFDEKHAAQILTVIAYMTCRGNVMEHILDWCEGFTLNEECLCDKQASALFAAITHDERMKFFKAWSKMHSGDKYLAYDVTSLSSYAEGIEDTEWGYNRDGDKLPQLNLGCYVGYDSKLPLFYVTYPGSIVDKSHMSYMMAYNTELGISNVTFVMDKGFCSTLNIRYMHSAQFPYIIGAEVRNKATLSAIENNRDEIVSMSKRIEQGVYAHCVRGFFYGELTNLHIYFDPVLAENHRSDLYRLVETQEEKLCQLEQLTKRDAKRYHAFFDIVLNENGTFSYERNYVRIDNAARNSGFFCLLTSTELNSADVLAHYRRKDVIEKSFDELKNHVDMKRLRTHNTLTTAGKMFCAFLSLIAVSQINIALANQLENDLIVSKNSVISELEKIKVIFASDSKRLMNPITKTQRVIFDKFGLDEDDLKGYVINS